jgi:hypothetical protein
MNIEYSSRFVREFAAAPVRVQKAFDKQIDLFRQNPAHPSLRAKKYNVAIDLWQARVNRDWRFYFTMEGGTCYLHSITAHPK